MFRCTRDRFATTLNSVQNGLNWCNYCKSSCHEVTSEPVTMPDPHNWTLNLCYSVFRNVWVHLGQFRYCNKLGAKCAELVQLMQKFMPRRCVGTLRYERAQSTTHVLLHFVKFGCIWDRFATALNSVKNGPNWCN